MRTSSSVSLPRWRAESSSATASNHFCVGNACAIASTTGAHRKPPTSTPPALPDATLPDPVLGSPGRAVGEGDLRRDRARGALDAVQHERAHAGGDRAGPGEQAEDRGAPALVVVGMDRGTRRRPEVVHAACGARPRAATDVLGGLLPGDAVLDALVERDEAVLALGDLGQRDGDTGRSAGHGQSQAGSCPVVRRRPQVGVAVGRP